MPNMSGRSAPIRVGVIHREILAAAKTAKATGYSLKRDTGLPLSTCQRFLAGVNSPTLDTVERIAKAIGVRISVQKI